MYRHQMLQLHLQGHILNVDQLACCHIRQSPQLETPNLTTLWYNSPDLLLIASTYAGTLLLSAGCRPEHASGTIQGR